MLTDSVPRIGFEGKGNLNGVCNVSPAEYCSRRKTKYCTSFSWHAPFFFFPVLVLGMTKWGSSHLITAPLTGSLIGVVAPVVLQPAAA